MKKLSIDLDKNGVEAVIGNPTVEELFKAMSILLYAGIAHYILQFLPPKEDPLRQHIYMALENAADFIYKAMRTSDNPSDASRFFGGACSHARLAGALMAVGVAKTNTGRRNMEKKLSKSTMMSAMSMVLAHIFTDIGKIDTEGRPLDDDKGQQATETEKAIDDLVRGITPPAPNEDGDHDE